MMMKIHCKLNEMILQFNGLVSKAASKNLEHRPNKWMTYALQKQINKKTLRYKGKQLSHKIVHLS